MAQLAVIHLKLIIVKKLQCAYGGSVKHISSLINLELSRK